MKSHVSSSHLVHPLPFFPLSFLCLSFSVVLSLFFSFSLSLSLSVFSRVFYRARARMEHVQRETKSALRRKEVTERKRRWREKWCCRRKSAKTGWEHAKWSPTVERKNRWRTGAKVKIRRDTLMNNEKIWLKIENLAEK